MHTPHEAFHAHLHEVIVEARRQADAEALIPKAPVRIKPANFLVAYYHEGEPQVEGTIECDSGSAALELQKDIEKDGTRTQIFVSQTALGSVFHLPEED